MISDRLTILLEELGRALMLKIAPDPNGACMLRYPDGLEVRIDPDKLGEKIYVSCELGAVPQGKFRENIFREALKANGLPPPQNGIFCFHGKKESLYIYDQLPMVELNGIRLSELIQGFVQKARIWKEGIARGEVPSYRSAEMSYSPRGSGLFGLR